MLEFVLAFPLILTLIMGCMQFAHLWMGKQVIHYAAFCAARAALVCEEGEWQKAGKQAAEQVCAWVVNGMSEGETDKQVPGWGDIPGSGGVARKTKVTIEKIGQWNVKATVEHDFALIMPIAGPMIGWLCNPWEKEESGKIYDEQKTDQTGKSSDDWAALDMIPYPHLRFVETVYMSKPYVTLPKMGIPSGGW